MNDTNKMLLSDLIEAGNDERLKEMRDGYTAWLPTDKLCDEDKEICGVIDDYFSLKDRVTELISEKITEIGAQFIEFDFENFHVEANTFASFDRGTYDVPDYSDSKIIDYKITIDL